MGVVIVFLLLALPALGDMYALGTKDRTRRPHMDALAAQPDDSNAPDSRIVSRFNHTPVVDSLVPVAHSNESATPSNNKQLTAAVVAFVVAFVGLCTIIAVLFFVVRYFMRRAAVKRRRQASWILRSGQWNMEPKRTDTHETRTGCSDTSASFSDYPYPLSEHF